MAYITQTEKAVIAAELKAFMPKGWKWSLSIKHNSTLRLKIQAATRNLLEHVKSVHVTRNVASWSVENGYIELWGKSQASDHFRGELQELFTKIFATINKGNYDRSDLMHDCFDVGFYSQINIGTGDKPFKFIA